MCFIYYLERNKHTRKQHILQIEKEGLFAREQMDTICGYNVQDKV